MTDKTVTTPVRKGRVVQRLTDLTLTADDFVALRRQGTVCRENRNERVYFKLRFRTAEGRQRVRYLGTDPAVAAKIGSELRVLQRHHRQLRSLRSIRSVAFKALRRAKEQSREAVEVMGYHFHGFEIRQRRGRDTAATHP